MIKINLKLLILISCIIILNSTNFVFANISGVVYDKSNNTPISGIKVQIKNEKIKTFTNQKGEFRIETKNDVNVNVSPANAWGIDIFPTGNQ